MPFLQTLTESKSHKSWETLDVWGSEKLLRVERRTKEGLKKNDSWKHKLAFSAEDLEPFRIIVLEREEEKVRTLVAISKTEKGILQNWEILKSFLVEEMTRAQQAAGQGATWRGGDESNLLALFRSEKAWRQVYKDLMTLQAEKASQMSVAPSIANSAMVLRGSATNRPRVAGVAPSECPTDITERGDISVTPRQSAAPISQGIAAPREEEARLAGVNTPSAVQDTTPSPVEKKNKKETPGLIGNFFALYDTERRSPAPMTKSNQFVVLVTCLLFKWIAEDFLGGFTTFLCMPFIAHTLAYAVLGTDKSKATQRKVPDSGTTFSQVSNANKAIAQMKVDVEKREAVEKKIEPESTALTASALAKNARLQSAASSAPSRKIGIEEGPRVAQDGDFWEVIMKYYNDTAGWKLKVADKGGIKFSVRDCPEYCDKEALMLSTVIPGATPWSFNAVINDDNTPDRSDKQSSSFKTDGLAESRKRLKILDQNKAAVMYTKFKAPVWGIAPRDFVTHLHECLILTAEQQKKHNVFIEPPKGQKPCVLLQCGVNATPEDRSSFPLPKGTQRGDIHFFGYVAQQIFDPKPGMKLTLMMLVDPCGSIPSSVINMTQGEQVTKLKKIRDLIEKKGPVDCPPLSNIHDSHLLSGGSSSAAQAIPLHGLPSTSVLAASLDTTVDEKLPGSDASIRPIALVPDSDDIWTTFKSYYTKAGWDDKAHSDSSNISWQILESPRPSKCNKKALKFKTFVPNATVWAFNQALNDDKSPNLDSKDSKVYYVDTLLNSRSLIQRIPPKDGGVKGAPFNEQLVLRMQYKSPVWGIAPREMQTVAYDIVELTPSQKRELGLNPEKTALLQCAKSAPDQYVVPVGKKHQKGEVLTFGFLCFERDTGVEIHMCMHIDPAGSLPTSVVETTNSEQLIKIRRLAELTKKEGNVGPPEGWSPHGTFASSQTTTSTTTVPGGVVKKDDNNERKTMHPLVVNWLEKLYFSNGWDADAQKHNKSKTMTMRTKTVPWVKFKAVRIDWQIQPVTGGSIKMEHVEKLFTDLSLQKKLDKMIDDKYVVKEKKDSDGTVVKLTVTKVKSPMWGVAARDIVQDWLPSYPVDSLDLRQKYKLPNATPDKQHLKVWFTVGASSEDIEPQPGFTRVLTYAFGYVGCENEDGSVTMCNMISANPGGALPATLVETSNASQLSRLEATTQELLDYMKTAPPVTHETLNVPPLRLEAPVSKNKNAAPLPEDVPTTEALHPIVVTWLEKLLHTDGWDKEAPKFSKDKKIKMICKQVPWTKFKAVRMDWVIPAGPSGQKVDMAKVAETFPSIEVAKKLDPMVEDKVVLKEKSQLVKLAHTKFKSPMWGIAARDMIQDWIPSYYIDSLELRQKHNLPNSTPETAHLKLWITSGISVDDVPPQKPYTRSTIYAFGMMGAEQPDGSVKMIYSWSANPGGSFPVSIVDAANVGQFEKMEKMSQIVREQSGAL